MAETNILKRYLDAGMAFTSMTQARAEEIIKELVKTGEIQTENAQAALSDLLERSRRNTEELLEQVRRDIANSAESLGLATVADLTRIEKLIDAISPSKATETATAAKKTATKKVAAAKKSVAKKTGSTKKAATKKPAAKKASTAKKSAAKKSGAAKKTAAKKASSNKS